MHSDEFQTHKPCPKLPLWFQAYISLLMQDTSILICIVTQFVPPKSNFQFFPTLLFLYEHQQISYILRSTNLNSV